MAEPEQPARGRRRRNRTRHEPGDRRNGGSTAGGSWRNGRSRQRRGRRRAGGAGCAGAGLCGNEGVISVAGASRAISTQPSIYSGWRRRRRRRKLTRQQRARRRWAGGGAIQITALGTLTLGGRSPSNGGARREQRNDGTACARRLLCASGTAEMEARSGFKASTRITVPVALPNAECEPGAAGLGNGAAGESRKIRGDQPGVPGSDGAWTTGGALGGGSRDMFRRLRPAGPSSSSAPPTILKPPTPLSHRPNSHAERTCQYAASTDGGNFTSFTTDITSLSNQNYRYLKFKITFNAASQNFVNSISIPYDGPSLDTVDLSLAAGCGASEEFARNGTRGGGHGVQ